MNDGISETGAINQSGGRHRSLIDYQCEVIAHRVVGNSLKIITLKPVLDNATGELPQVPFVCNAGEFVMVDLPTDGFSFRRPMSVFDSVQPTVDAPGSLDFPYGTFEIFYKIHGRGTAMMADFPLGQAVNVLGPLGNTFVAPEKTECREKTLMIGGGIGIAPLHLLAKQWKEHASSEQAVVRPPACFYGVRSQAEIAVQTELESVFGDKLFVSTDDGSSGTQGNVCDLLRANAALVREAGHAYICGPTPMMRAAAALLAEMNPSILVVVSLEEHMPCGTGACTGCVVFRTDRDLPSKTCVEGPVFLADSIDWDASRKVSHSTASSSRLKSPGCASQEGASCQ